MSVPARQARGAFAGAWAAALTGTLLVAAPIATRAQPAPTLGGIEARLGVVFPEHASVGTSIFGEVDIGHLRTPPLRGLVGLSHFRANIDREGGGDEGSFAATGVWLGGRYDLLSPLRDVAPYVRAQLTVQRVSADAFDRDVGALLRGTYIGSGVGVGMRYMLDAIGHFMATAELRRTFLNNVGHTSLELGARVQRRGSRAYAVAPAPVWLDPVRADAPVATPPPAATPPAAAAPPVPPPVAGADTVARATVPEPAPTAALPAAPTDAALIAARAAAAEAMLRQALARASAGMRAAAPVREDAEAFVVTVGGGAFATGAATLAGAARAELRVLASVLAGYPGHIISVEGHSDAVGNAAANQRLSEERAAAVRAALIVEGVDPLWIGAIGWGDTQPVASNATTSGRATNRRVEIFVQRRQCPTAPVPAPDGRPLCPL